MTCPHCKSTATTERPDRTVLGYRRFRCRACRRGFHERTGTLFHDLEYPTEAFFRSAWTVTGVAPDRITTDGHDAYPHSIRHVFGERVTHRTNRYLNHQVEQDHRGIKQRYWPMGGFKQGKSAARFCRLFDEIRAFCRPQSHRNPVVSLTQRRDLYHDRFAQLMGMMAAV